MKTFPRFLAIVLIGLFGVIARVQAQTVINALPYTITTNGLYVLNNNLYSSTNSGNLITINAGNVTIDFQSHYISGADAGNLTGIYALNRNNVTVKNGTVAHCYQGITFVGSTDANGNILGANCSVIDNMRVISCSNSGITVTIGPSSRITNCQVSQIGTMGQDYTTGIFGGQCLIQGNTVTNVFGENYAYGISTGFDQVNTITQGSLVTGNMVSGVQTITNGNGAHAGYGIYLSKGFARQNSINTAMYGVYGGKYQDNITLGCTTPFSGGADAGGNN